MEQSREAVPFPQSPAGKLSKYDQRDVRISVDWKAMERLQAFQDAAHKSGFVDVEETEDGNVLWLKKPTANAEDRMCIDSLTNSVTVFWATIPWKINSKTFRAVSALQDWLVSTSKVPQP